jgi:hypothetical protein
MAKKSSLPAKTANSMKFLPQNRKIVTILKPI